MPGAPHEGKRGKLTLLPTCSWYCTYFDNVGSDHVQPARCPRGGLCFGLGPSTWGRSEMRRPNGFARFVGRQGFHCLYLVTAEHDGSLKIGVTADVTNSFSSLRSASPVELRLHRHWWLAGKLISRRIKKSFRETFEAQRIGGDWFATPLPEAEAFIERMIHRIGTWGATDAEMIAEMQRRERQSLSRMLPQ